MQLSPTAQAALADVQAQLAAFPESVVTEIPEDGDYDHRLAAHRVLWAQVCTRKTPAEAAEWLTQVRPPGVDRRWEFDPEHGEVACEEFPDTHRHVICVC